MQLRTSALVVVGQIPTQSRTAPVEDELANRPEFFLDPLEFFGTDASDKHDIMMPSSRIAAEVS